MRDIISNIAVASVIAPAPYDADNTPAAIDLGGFDSAMLAIHCRCRRHQLQRHQQGGIQALALSDDDATYEPVTDADVQGVAGVTSGIVLALKAAHPDPSVTRVGYRRQSALHQAACRLLRLRLGTADAARRHRHQGPRARAPGGLTPFGRRALRARSGLPNNGNPASPAPPLPNGVHGRQGGKVASTSLTKDRPGAHRRAQREAASALSSGDLHAHRHHAGHQTRVWRRSMPRSSSSTSPTAPLTRYLGGLIGRASRAIESWCGRVFAREGVRETVHLTEPAAVLLLSRFPVAAITSSPPKPARWRPRSTRRKPRPAWSTGSPRPAAAQSWSPGRILVDYAAGFLAAGDEGRPAGRYRAGSDPRRAQRLGTRAQRPDRAERGCRRRGLLLPMAGPRRFRPTSPTSAPYRLPGFA